MIDIGLNLTSSQFRNDIDQVLNDAQEAGIVTMIVTGTSVESSLKAYELTNRYPNLLYSTAGIHPHDAKTLTADSLVQLRQLLSHNNVLAVGECGLDFNRNFSTPSDQLSCFEKQLELAVELQMPIFLHQRDAQKDFLRLLKKYRSGLVDGVAHCFTGGRAELEDCLEQELHIGITGWLCDDQRGKALQNCVALIPDNKLMIETDAPYLFPKDLNSPLVEALPGKKKKFSRKRNEPKYLPHILKTLSRLTHKTESELAHLTTENARRFFRLA